MKINRHEMKWLVFRFRKPSFPNQLMRLDCFSGPPLSIAIQHKTSDESPTNLLTYQGFLPSDYGNQMMFLQRGGQIRQWPRKMASIRRGEKDRLQRERERDNVRLLERNELAGCPLLPTSTVSSSLYRRFAPDYEEINATAARAITLLPSTFA